MKKLSFIEALKEMYDGKIVKELSYDLLYKIINNKPFFRELNSSEWREVIFSLASMMNTQFELWVDEKQKIQEKDFENFAIIYSIIQRGLLFRDDSNEEKLLEWIDNKLKKLKDEINAG